MAIQVRETGSCEEGKLSDYQLLSVDALGYELINKRFRNPVLVMRGVALLRSSAIR